jgi:acetyltransferase-like isoleucine patch superfamily enzyme
MGGGNVITIKSGSICHSPLFHIIGNNNEIIIEEGCRIGPKCSFWMEGDNIKIIIGPHTTFTDHVHINAQEDNSFIKIGEDCMLSNHIIIRTSDSHPIYSITTHSRINSAKPIIIGNHVWIAPHSEIMKGSIIEDGVIVGSQTMVNKLVPQNSLVVGRPMRVVKNDIYWTREDIIFHKK